MFSSEEVEELVEELDEDVLEVEDRIRRFLSDIETESERTEISTVQYAWNDAGDSVPMKREAKIEYEKWHAKAEELVREYRATRLEDFQSHYETIQETLRLGGDTKTSTSPEGVTNETFHALDAQTAIIRSIIGKIEVKELKARRQVSKNVARNEIEQAWQLFEGDFIRAAGVVAAVAVERELMTLCEESEQVAKFNPSHGISRLSQTLYEADVIDKTSWNEMKKLASIRETCAHAEDPEKHRVRTLISGSEEFVRG
ncbi:hypothetical protein [Halorubellus salinus]|uniref:hypothetical protein n=1 Tax=Halorubellus salinus TaxID=755309 RepID=UPI001D086C64|nr:hypothetical protein [Halorubellus salinus]